MRMEITEDEFAGMFRDFAHSAWRLETRDHYALGYEEADYRRFLDGSPVPPPEVEWWRPWLDHLASVTRQGREIGRVRVLAEPPTDYQRWELWAAPWHATAGERIGYMPRSKARRIGLPADRDWWMFDEQRLVIMGFSDDGEITGKTLVTDPDVVAQHCEWRDLAVRYATPAEGIAAA
jgi:hypothetical protein